MKQVSLLVLSFFLVLSCKALEDSLMVYAGRYKFPNGSSIREVDIVFSNGMLLGYSSTGNSAFKKVPGKHVFLAYNGIATFIPNREGKITHLKLEFPNLVLEGRRANPSPARIRMPLMASR